MGDSSGQAEGNPGAGRPVAERSELTLGMVWRRSGAVLRRLGPAGPMAVIAASLPFIGSLVLLGSLKWLAPWLQGAGRPGMALFVAGFAITSGLAILPTQAQSAVGGWSFGFARGAALSVAGVLGGAILGYCIARRLSGERVVALIHEHPRCRAVYDALLGRGFWKSLFIVTLLRIPPNSPFALTNLVMAGTRVPAAAYVLGSAMGLAPRTIAVAFIAAGLHDLDFKNLARSWLTIAGFVAMIVVILIIGAIANRAIARLGANGRPASVEGARA